MTIEFIRSLLLSVLLYFPLLVRWLTCGMNFLYCAFRIPEGKRENAGSCVLLKEQHSARKTRLKNGKIDNVFILAESQAEGYYPLSLALKSPLIRTVFLSTSTANCKTSREKWNCAVGQPCSPPLFHSNTFARNSRWKICFLWTQCRATREGKLKTRKRNVSQAWIFQRMRARTKKKRRNASHVHDMWHSRRRTNCCPLCRFIAIARRSSHAIKVVLNTN